MLGHGRGGAGGLVLGTEAADVIRVETSLTFHWVPDAGNASVLSGAWSDWVSGEEVSYGWEGPSAAVGSITFHGVSSGEVFSVPLSAENFHFRFTGGRTLEGLERQGLESGAWSWDPLAGALVAGEGFTAWDNWVGLWIGLGSVNVSTSHWSGYSSETEFGHWALLAAPRDAVVYAGAGNDTIYGGQGDQMLDGGEGDDAIWLGRGDGLAQGREGNDTLHGGAGTQTLDGGTGNDLVVGGRGAQILHGGRGADELRGGTGSQFLYGDGGRDVLRGGTGAQVLDGGDGGDVLVGGQGAQVLRGGGGADELRGGAGAQTLLGGAGDDVLWTGADGAQVLRGEAGQDVLHAGGEGGTLFGGAGRDTFVFHGALVRGAVTVADFRPGQDVVLLVGGGVSADLGAHLRSNQAGDAVLVGDNGGMLTLAGFSEFAARAHGADWFVLAA